MGSLKVVIASASAVGSVPPEGTRVPLAIIPVYDAPPRSR